MAEDRYAKGMRIRREVLGDAYVDQALKKVDEFSSDFQHLITEYCWGAVWGREGLARKQRSLINLGILAALGRRRELETHLRGAVTNGCTREEIRETLMQVAVYAGIPAAIEAFDAARTLIDAGELP